tara:strand:- start:7321 stop:7461 length:141 start_codon:yes stop_codon:yes gene_type:complete
MTEDETKTKPEDGKKPKSESSTTISGHEIILLFLFGPIVITWLGLG